MRRDMTAPVWEGVTLIPDEITKAGSGQIVVTAVMLYSVKILRAAGVGFTGGPMGPLNLGTLCPGVW